MWLPNVAILGEARCDARRAFLFVERNRWKMSRKSEKYVEKKPRPPYYDREEPEPELTDEHVNSRAKALIPWLGGVFVGVLLVLTYSLWLS
jgi:hypothetical protein